ncbi:hypothetical protein HAX54_016451 [Datura stramonium]|uniref:Uncharacterized protein n=1 Tax=Datura stramonium TaxID=4076 RepID=A0ABS8UK55_DATST|nr:hypothetical protein [Datura stramonium]
MNSSWKYYSGEEVAAASLSNFIHWRKPYDASNHLGELLLTVVKIFPKKIQMILRNSKRLICRNLEGLM